jgi:hypothetical protein
MLIHSDDCYLQSQKKASAALWREMNIDHKVAHELTHAHRALRHSSGERISTGFPICPMLCGR